MTKYPLSIPILILCLLGQTACVPTHTVRPLPQFVLMALEPGDSVEITLLDGQTLKLMVSAVHADAIEAGGQRFELDQIVDIQKRAWREPPYPCGGEKPVGCSVPLLVSLASESTRHFEGEFHDACVQHDFCYRHGARSYGYTRDDCDAEFLDNMLAACPPPPRGVLTKTLELFDDSSTSRGACISTAEAFHGAIRRFGDKYFLTDQSTYCEYDGPPLTSEPSNASPDP